MSRQSHIQRILEAIGSITREFNVRGNYPFKDYSLGRPHIDVLFFLSQTESLNIKELSERLNVTSGAVTQIVDYLQERTLVVRCENPHDKRSRLVSISPRARDELNAFRHEYYASHTGMFDDLDVDELATLHELLTKVRNSL